MTHQVAELQAPSRPSAGRIVGAIALKDLSQTVQNRALLSIILSTLFVLLMYRFLPLLGNEAQPAVLLHDPAGESALTAALDSSDEVRAYIYDSPNTVTTLLQHGDVPEMGLVLPDDIQAQLASGGPLTLSGQFNYWVSAREATAMADQVAGILSAELGRPVTIAVDPNRVYAAQDSSGLPFLLAISLVIAVLMAGMGAVPLLMLEEKKTRTMDALLVSPATPAHITLGKAVAGLVLAFAAAAVALLLYRAAVVHWGLALAAVLGWSLWAVSAGLLAGTLVKERAQHQIIMWVMFIPLIIPAFLMVMIDLLPDWLPAYLRLLPSTATMELLRMTGMAALSTGEIVWRLALVYGTALLILAGVVWAVRRQKA